MSGVITQDFYGHQTPSSGGVSAAPTGATSGTAAGTIVAGATSNGVAPLAISANDSAGQFTIVGNGTPAAGILATVFFAQPYPAAPKSVLVQCFDQTGTVTLVSGWQPVAAGLGTGFAIYTA